MTTVPVVSVLVVEDVPEMLELLAQVVEGIPGFEVSGRAANGWDARLELGRRRPDIVLLDEILPGESSGDLLREIQALGIPVVLVSGVEEAKHALPAGVHYRLGKPGWDTLGEDRKAYEEALREALGASLSD